MDTIPLILLLVYLVSFLLTGILFGITHSGELSFVMVFKLSLLVCLPLINTAALVLLLTAVVLAYNQQKGEL